MCVKRRRTDASDKSNARTGCGGYVLVPPAAVVKKVGDRAWRKRPKPLLEIALDKNKQKHKKIESCMELRGAKTCLILFIE